MNPSVTHFNAVWCNSLPRGVWADMVPLILGRTQRNIDERDKKHMTPLMWAAAMGHVDVIKVTACGAQCCASCQYIQYHLYIVAGANVCWHVLSFNDDRPCLPQPVNRTLPRLSMMVEPRSSLRVSVGTLVSVPSCRCCIMNYRFNQQVQRSLHADTHPGCCVMF